MIYINININCNELIPCTTTPALTFSTFPTSTPNYNPLLDFHSIFFVTILLISKTFPILSFIPIYFRSPFLFLHFPLISFTSVFLFFFPSHIFNLFTFYNLHNYSKCTDTPKHLLTTYHK